MYGRTIRCMTALSVGSLRSAVEERRGHTSQLSISESTYETLRTWYHEDSAQSVDTFQYSRESFRSVYYYRDVGSQKYIEVGARYSNPLSLKWQFDASCGGTAFFKGITAPDATGLRWSMSQVYDLETRYSLTYVANSRTSSRHEAQIMYEHYRREILDSADTVILGERPGQLTWGINCQLVYRVSLPTTLQLRASLYSNDTDDDYLESGGIELAAILAIIQYDTLFVLTAWKKLPLHPVK